MTRVLLLSTYELGGQPIGLAGPATALLEAGHEVRAHDLAVEDWPSGSVEWADAVACSVPMHTALRLGLAAIERVRTDRPDIPVAYYGLYAPVAAEVDLLGPDDFTVADGALEALVGFADRLGPRGPDASHLITGRFLLPGLSEYARYVDADGERLVGPVESTVGCNHRCRHCPVPLVFDGRSRAVALEEVLADVDALVALGATHIHFADPDFLNRPQHARRVARAVHERHPTVTFDATIKVSHILRHPQLMPELAESGLRFVTSA
ncbi:MAG TPA: radical SAM protein, partial [Acidimicrobiales bacterium]|nr:radical SAM protein [Acidimicrobiales bacterium]